MLTLSATDSPPRAPPAKYHTPLGTRWQKEKAAAAVGAFDYPEDAKYVGPWIIGECVGKGASGHVKVAKHRRTGQLAAIKILPLQPFVHSRTNLEAQAKSDKQQLGIDREITMMKLMDHPNIMRIYDVYEGEKELYLILEYIEGGELFDFLVNRGKLPPQEALAYFKQIVYGLNYAHTFSIIHRDLKPENILIHSLNPPLIKIADWGMAAFAPPSLQLETSCGSPHYASPEIVNGHKYCGNATDIWSCGVILFALLTGRLPFDDKNVRTLLSKVKVGKYDMPSFIDPLAKDLLSRMLVVDVTRRITMTEILAHPWLEGATPGIQYVPAPPVSELARPLASASHIDKDIFESLCVIWGRHADNETIKADLLSPAGQGTLAKAFYFLLLKHREKTMEEHGILIDVDSTAKFKVVTKQYAAPRTKRTSLPEPLDTSKIQYQLPAPGAYTQPARGPSPAILTDEFVDRPPSRPHPPPAGPRPQKPRPASSIASGRPKSIFVSPDPRSPSTPHIQSDVQRAPSQLPPFPIVPSDAQSHIRPPSTYAYSRDNPALVRRTSLASTAAVNRASLALNGVIGDRYGVHQRSMAFSTPGAVHAPVPVPVVPLPALPTVSSPRVPEADVQKALDQYTNRLSIHAGPWDVAPAHDVLRALDPDPFAAHVPVREEPRVPMQDVQSSLRAEAHGRHSTESANKENWNKSSAARRHVHSEPFSSGGLGFGHSVPMTKEMGNVLFFNDANPKDQMKEKKDRKNRPSLDLSGISSLQKRSTFSIMGSPRPMSPPTSLIGSPVVGEFKGWFSNLFHWKVQSYLLYSADDLQTTRLEVARLLESFGVVVVLEENQGWSVLKCRLDEANDGSGPMQKQVRFRVEFSAGPAAQTYSQPGTTPRLSRDPTSPRTSTLSPTRIKFDTVSGYETVLGLVLEKGAVSTFKAVYQRLRNEWRLDALQSPKTASLGGATPSMEQRFMAYFLMDYLRT
ncbi:Pkinase-domain-containing protein [Obba rivulosa]|uniref:Pkinase-domain-containing protein n=1 Tax=Obba rivulosa TaxID=1052685 RepID=A0A8E2AKY5_9APHY|nr:Pkinase-domain-containing protein [Obba rivulosa]